MNWKPTIRLRLTPQESPRVQAALFDIQPETKPPCEHPASGLQIRLDGQTDRVCTTCGAIIH